jgi:hypothetical protein
MSANYFVFADKQYGPYDMAAVRGMVAAGRLAKDAWVFHEGETTDWTRAADIPSLAAFFPIAAAAQAAPRANALAGKLEKAREVAVVPPPKPIAATVLAPPDAATQVHKMEVNLPEAPLSDLRRPHESIRMAPLAPPPTPGRWLSVLQRLFGRKEPS